jgi:xanthine dehydrogenase accessory factor
MGGVNDLLPAIFDRLARGERVALCTVVRTRGSAPQSAGAAMLVTAGGQTQGTLGGGCVEAEVRIRALKLLQRPQGESDRLLVFRLDNDYGWDDGLVCGGVMDVAVQVLDADAPHAARLREAAARLASREPTTLGIAVADEAGGAHTFEISITPPPVLVIAGAGHVGQALARIAAPAGFELVVIDDRSDLATPQRFAGARVVIGEIDRELARLATDAATYVVIVTRGHRHDAAALAAVIAKPAAYVGLIGSKRKVRRILEGLHRAGTSLETLSRVRAPIGLAINAVTPGEIAVSIAAELIAVRRGATLPAGPMRLSDERLRAWVTRPAK